MKNDANRWDLVLSAEETWLVNSSAQKVVVVFQRNIGITAKTDDNKQEQFRVKKILRPGWMFGRGVGQKKEY